MIPYNGATLAYVGDAVLELKIREHLLAGGLTKVNDLHKAAIRYTAATGQAKAAEKLLAGFLSEAEADVFRRGRNAESSHKPKNADLATYHQATGLEALIGFLYLEGKHERLEALLQATIRAIEELL